VDVQGGYGARGRTFAPQLVDQPITGERDAAAEEHQRKKGALTAAGQWHGLTVPLQNERPKHSKAAQTLVHPRPKGTGVSEPLAVLCCAFGRLDQPARINFDTP
jgi:hypothetical protein